MPEDPNAYRVPILRLSDIVGDDTISTKNGSNQNDTAVTGTSFDYSLQQEKTTDTEVYFQKQEMSSGGVFGIESGSGPKKTQEKNAIPEEPTPHMFGDGFVGVNPLIHTQTAPAQNGTALGENNSTGVITRPTSLIFLHQQNSKKEENEGVLGKAPMQADVDDAGRPLRAWESAIAHRPPIQKPVVFTNPPDIWESAHPTQHDARRNTQKNDNFLSVPKTPQNAPAKHVTHKDAFTPPVDTLTPTIQNSAQHDISPIIDTPAPKLQTIHAPVHLTVRDTTEKQDVEIHAQTPLPPQPVDFATPPAHEARQHEIVQVPKKKLEKPTTVVDGTMHADNTTSHTAPTPPQEVAQHIEQPPAKKDVAVPVPQPEAPKVPESKPKSNLGELRNKILKEGLRTREDVASFSHGPTERSRSLVQVDIAVLQESARMLADLSKDSTSSEDSATKHADAIAGIAKNLEELPKKETPKLVAPKNQDQRANSPTPKHVTPVSKQPTPPTTNKVEQFIQIQKSNVGNDTNTLPPPEPLSPMRTFKQDVERAVKRGDTATKRQGEGDTVRNAKNVFVRKARPSWLTPSVYLFAGASVVLISGAIISITIYFFPRGEWSDPTAYFKVEKTIALNVTNKSRETLMEESVILRNETTAKKGYITRIDLKKTIDIPLKGPEEVRLTTQGFFDQLDFDAPFNLRTTLNETFMLGLHHEDDGSLPFLVFESNNPEQVLIAMRTWEETLSEDLHPLFKKGEPYVPVRIEDALLNPTNVIEIKSTSTNATTSSQDMEEMYAWVTTTEMTLGEAPLPIREENATPTDLTINPPTATSTPINTPAEPHFVDTSIDNMPTRTLHDGNGNTVLVWAMLDKYVLVTSSETTIETLRKRMHARIY